MTPYQELVLDKIKRLGGQHRAVPSKLIAYELNKPVRTTTWHLKNLREAGALYHPQGAKQGWAVA